MAKRTRKHSIPSEVPLDAEGNLLRSEGKAVQYSSGKDRFIAALRLQSHKKVGNTYRLKMVDTCNGTTYPIFLTDYLKASARADADEGQIFGEWGYCKKSGFFGIYLVENIT